MDSKRLFNVFGERWMQETKVSNELWQYVREGIGPCGDNEMFVLVDIEKLVRSGCGSWVNYAQGGSSDWNGSMLSEVGNCTLVSD